MASTLGRSAPKPGDVVILSGTLGDHGMAIMSVREGLEFETIIQSDSAPLNGLVAAMLAVGGMPFTSARPHAWRRSLRR